MVVGKQSLNPRVSIISGYVYIENNRLNRYKEIKLGQNS